MSFGRTVFNSVFKSAFKVWKSDLVFFLLIIFFFSWNLIIFLLKVGQKSCGCFLKAAKNVRRRTIWYLLPEKMLFRFSTLNGKLPDFEKNFSKSTQSFIFCVQKKNLVIFFKWKLPLVKYFERKTSRLWSKFLRQKSQFFIFRAQRTFCFFSRWVKLFLDCKLKYWVPAEKFSTVFSKVHSRWGRQRTSFFWIP